MSCMASTASVAKSTIHYTTIVLGLALLHLGAALFGTGLLDLKVYTQNQYQS